LYKVQSEKHLWKGVVRTKNKPPPQKKMNELMIFYNKSTKAVPLQAWTGPEGSRRLRLPDFKTFGT
jgi:hypothetical protein